jgi:hypothetical protein
MADRVPAVGGPRPWREWTPRRQNLVALLLLFLATIPMLTKNFTSDFGTHIAIGRYIVQNRTIPDTEFLNYTSLGKGNFYGEWGFQALLYGVYSLGGIYGVSFLCWAVVFAIYLLLHRSDVLRGAHPLISFCAIVAFSGFLRVRIQPRPEIFTYLFVAITIFLFSEHFFGSRKKILLAFPVLMILWANMHPSYLIGFALCGAFIVDRLARAIWNKEFGWDTVKKWLPVPLLAGGLGLILCGLNPHGYGAILTPLHLLSRGAGGGAEAGGASILMSISELTPVKGTGFYAYYKAAALFALASFCLGTIGRRIYLLDLFLFAIAFKGAWDSARAVSMMGLFLSPGISLQLTGFLSRTEEWFSPKAPRKRLPDRAGGKKKGAAPERGAWKAGPESRPYSFGRVAVTAVTVLALLGFGGTTLAFSFRQLEYGIGITEHKFSFQAVEFLRANPIPGKMFNFFDIGGFLDWQLYPQALTFIDGRTYNRDVFMEHQMVTGAAPEWESVLRKYGVTYIVLKGMDSSGTILPIVPTLASHPNWALVFSDGLFLVFVRNIPELRGYIQRHEIPKGVLPQHIVRESWHYMFLGVHPVTAYQTMSNMYLIMGNREMAIRMLRLALRELDDPALRARLLQLEGGPGTR